MLHDAKLSLPRREALVREIEVVHLGHEGLEGDGGVGVLALLLEPFSERALTRIEGCGTKSSPRSESGERSTAYSRTDTRAVSCRQMSM